jgi:PAS domain S-box-containing protein
MPDAPLPSGLSQAWAALLETLPVGVLVANAEGRYVQANAAASRILGFPREALLASGLPEPRSQLLAANGSVLAPEDAPGVIALRTGRPVHRQELGMVGEDGDVLWLEVSAEPLPEGGVLVTFDDVTKHHLTESILAARARIAELAATATLEQILRTTLDEAERLTGSCIGFYHFMEADQQSLTLQAWSTRTENEFCMAIGKGRHYPLDQAGIWADAARTKRPLIHNDFANVPNQKGMPEGHAAVQRELVVPVLRGDQVVALLGVGNKPFPYGNRDLQTVLRLADLAWDIAERKRSEDALRTREADYRSQFEEMTQGAFRQGADGNLIDVNAAALELLGLTRDEFLGRTSQNGTWDVVGENGTPLQGEAHPSMIALATGKKVTGQVVGVRNGRTGQRVWMEVNAIPEFRPGAALPYRVLVTLHDLTARRQLEESLRDSEARWQTLMQQAGDGFEVLDEDGRFLQVNAATCRTLGYTPEEMAGLTVRNINPGLTPELFRAKFDALIGQPPATFESLHRRKDGTEVPVEVTASIINLGGQNRALTLVRNISDRKRTEAALQASKDLLNLVLDSLEAHVAVVDREGNILAVNEPWRRFAHENGIQLTAGTVERVNYLDVLAASCQDNSCDAEDIRQGLVEVLTGGRASFAAEYPCDSPTESRWFRMHVLPLGTNQDGAVITHENITAERQAMDGMKQAHDKLSLTLHASEAGLWEWDLAGESFVWSREMFQLYGLDLEVARADFNTFRQVVHPEDLKAVEAHMRKVLEERKPFSNDYRVVWPNGEVHWIQAHGSFDLNAQGQPLRMVGICLDCTERKVAESDLAVSEARLRAIVENSRDAIGVSRSGLHIMANPAYRVMFGLEAGEDITGLSILELIAPEDRELVVQYARERAARGTAPSDYEVNALRRDGNTFRMEVHASTYELDGEVFTLVILRDITARKEAETLLRENEARFRAMFEDSPIGIWEEDFSEVKASFDALRAQGVVDFRSHFSEHPEGVVRLAGQVRILRINRASVATLKAASESEVVRNLPAYFTPSSLEVFKEELCALAEGRTQFRSEGSHLDSQGNLLDFDISLIVQPGFEASLSRVLVSFVEITERKAIETALRDSQLRMVEAMHFNDQLLAAMPIGAAAYRGDSGGCLMVNAALAHLTGGTQEALEQQTFRELPSWQASGMVAVAERVLRSDTDEHLEVQVTSSFGRKVWLSCEFSSFASGEGRNLLILCADISGRKQADLALLQSERQYRGLFDTMKEGFALHEIITNEAGQPVDYRFLDVNPAFVAMTGLARDQWIGRTVREILPGVEPRWITEYGEVAATGRPITFEDESKDLGRWYRVTAYRPAPRQFAVLVTDVTEPKRLATEHRQLEQQVARTQKMESLGSLAGGVAHDMNNVLGAIMGLASVHQEQSPVDSRLHKSMATILKACTRGRTLVKGLLGFARQGLEEIRVLDLNEVIREEVALLERTIPATVRVEADLHRGLRLIHGDPAALSHVLMNLCLNAVDAMPQGGTLTLRTANEGSGLVTLEVADTGCGMTPDVLEKAMDPFFTTKSQGKGTGLGLAIVYGAVKAHHAQLKITSEPGTGTRITMHFPATTEMPASGLGSVHRVPVGHALSILVVDDDELIQDSLGELLRGMGHQPTMARSGEEALRLLDEGGAVDLVLLDLNMPGLGGAGTLPQLRAAHPDLPVLLSTGRADQLAMDLVARTAKTLLLPKPFSAEEIAAHIRQLGLY